MKTIRLMATMALAFVALTATAEKKPVVKVIGTRSDGISYWVKYTINGIECRSDMMGELCNASAWKYMSDEDKKKTYETFTFAGDRKEQFGVLCSLAMTTWYNEQNGTTQSRAYLQDGLVKKYHPELWERFSGGNRNKYYNENVHPGVDMGFDFSYSPFSRQTHCDHLGRYWEPVSPELELKFDAITLLWEWAEAAYDTLGPSEFLRTEAAVKSISGDLIQLIVDRVLVPNITPSGMLSGIEAIPSKIFGAVLDSANTLTGASDSLVKNVAGEKTDAKKARSVIDAANTSIEENVKIIENCLDGIQALRAEIQSQYPAVKAAFEARKKAVENAHHNSKSSNPDPRIVSEAFATYQTRVITNELAKSILRPRFSASHSLEYFCKTDEDLLAASAAIREYISAEKAFWYGTSHNSAFDMYSEDEDPRYKVMEARLQQALDVRAAYVEEQLRKQELRDDGLRSLLEEQRENSEKADKAYRLAGETLPIYVTEQQLGPNNLIVLDANTAIGKACLLPAAAGTASAEAAAYRKRLDALMEEKNKLRTACRVADEGLDLVESYLRSGGYGLGNKKQNKVKAANAYSTGDDVATDNYKKLTLLWQDFNNHNRFRVMETTYLFNLYENEEKYKKDIKGRYASPSEGDAGIIEHEIPDPYLHLALKAREFASHPSTWSNPYMYYSHMIGIYDDGQTLLFEARDGNRGLGSYAYFAKNYYKTYFGGQPDVFDDCVEPYLREIDSARAAASGVAEISYTVRFEPNGGTGGAMAPQTFIGWAPKALTANTWAPPSSGETFVGWARTPDGDVVFDDREVIRVSENMTLYARWSGSYSEGGGEGGGTVEPTPTDAPTLFGPVTAELPFTGDATYNGWVRNADGSLAGLLTVKAAKAAKPEKGGQSKLTITYIPFGGKKQTIKLANDAMPVAGGVATVAIPGVGTVKFTGDAIVGVDVDVQAGKDTLKSKDKAEKAAATAAAASKAGVWTFALGTDAAYAAFSVTVDKKGKGKLAGTLPDGTKVSVSAQGVLGDGVLAIPFTYAKKSLLGLVFWVKGDGTATLSDLTGVGAASVVAPSASYRLADGEHTFTAGGVSQGFTVAGKKWNVPKQNKRAEVDPNPTGLKLTFTEKTGAVKGTYTVADGKAKTKYTVVGVVVGGKLYGSAYARNAVPLPATAE